MFDVFYMGENPDLVEKVPFAKHVNSAAEVKSTTKMYWFIEPCVKLLDYDVLKFRPADHDQYYEHVWKWNSRNYGGVRLIPANREPQGIKEINQVASKKQFDVLRRTTPEDYFETHPYASHVWCVDAEYKITDSIDWAPDNFEPEYIHSFHLRGQLEHRYPEKEGGVKLYPRNWQSAHIKYHEFLTDYMPFEWERFDCEEQGRSKTKHDWFWVVEPNVTLLDNFNFHFVPEPWDSGKTHVWQKINPVTQQTYDYSGVMLCPREKKNTRPKYIKEPACVQKPYPVYQLDHTLDQITQLEQFDDQTTTDMFYVVDPLVKIKHGFDFSYYPTRWDQNYVQVFLCGDQPGGLRLYPKDYVKKFNLTAEDIEHNRMEGIKFLNVEATERKAWPIEMFNTQTVQELAEIIKAHTDSEFVFTLDSGQTLHDDFSDQHFAPEVKHLDKVHSWQRFNPDGRTIHGYGGLRLWPTNMDLDNIKTADIYKNNIRQRRYVRSPGSVYQPFDVVFISYLDPDASKKYAAIQAMVTNSHWIKDVKGIFNAHQQAAHSVSTRMFWVVDADAEVTPGFDFNYVPDVHDQNAVHVWHAHNPVTHDEYGYGGIKLFNTQQVLDATSWGLDFTTGIGKHLKVMPTVSCVTRFNTDAYGTWRSAFRECVKLSLRDDTESKRRLTCWLNPVHDADFAAEAQLGATQGAKFATNNRNRPSELEKINDFEWLRNEYFKHCT
jgi:hypothetical protein